MNKQHTLKRIVTFILTLIITVTGILFMPNVAHAAEWQQNNKGWRWQENDKTYATSEWKYINNHWYHFNESGYMDTGWTRVNGSWYYLGSANDGAMKYGWYYDTTDQGWYYLGGANDGAMKTGWQLVNHKWYYLRSSGRMAYNTWIGGYYVNADGAWVEDKTSGTTTTTQTTTQTGCNHTWKESFTTVKTKAYDDVIVHEYPVYETHYVHTCRNIGLCGIKHPEFILGYITRSRYAIDGTTWLTEDCVQVDLTAAFEHWKANGNPDGTWYDFKCFNRSSAGYTCSNSYCTDTIQVGTKTVEEIVHIPSVTTTKDIYVCTKCGAEKDR